MSVSTLPLLRWMPGLCALGLFGCANASVPPHIRSMSIQAGPAANFQNLEVDDEENSGPHPSLEASLSSLLRLDGTTATGIELRGNLGTLSPGGDLSGDLWMVALGARRVWRMDRPHRPTVSAGLQYSTFDQRGPAGGDIRGPGAYLGLGMESMITPRWGLGFELRPALHFIGASGDDEWTSSIDLAIRALYRF